MISISKLTVAQLEKAVAIKRQIETLEQELESLNGNNAPISSPARVRNNSGWTPEARARLAAAQKARWARARKNADSKAASASAVVAEKPKKKRKMSAEAKARLSEAAKARWAKVKAEESAA
jgi:hypothetical protein